MPSGYLVDLGDAVLDSGDVIGTQSRQFSADSTLGVGSWTFTATQGQTTTTLTETGVYYLSTTGAVYFVPDGGKVNGLTSANAATVPSYNNTDGIVSGTDTGELIDASFIDSDGDAIDAGTGGGASGFDDSVEAGGGNDTVLSGQGNDTVYGGWGADSISGGDGADVIYGDTGSTGASSTETFQWSSVGGDKTDVSDGFTQTVGNIDVTVAYLNTGNAPKFAIETSDTMYSASGESFSSNSAVAIGGNGTGDPSRTTITFDAASGSGLTNETQNVSFRLNDIDVSNGGMPDTVTVTAYDAAGNEIAVTLTAAGNDTISGNTITAGATQETAADQNGSVLVEIAGPVHRIDIDFQNGDVSQQLIYMTDIVFGTTSGEGGADTIDGGAGDDIIYGEDGSDSLIGGDGNDTIYGGANNAATLSTSENLSWSSQGADGADATAGFTQSTGTMDVTVDIVDDGTLSAARFESTDTT